MKKFLFLSVAILALVLGSCSKSSKLNRKLDGKWELVSNNGVAATADEKFTIEFTKDKDGKGTLAYTVQGMSFAGTYVLDKDEKITITLTFLGQTEASVLTVEDYSKSTLILVDGTDKTEFKKL